MRGGSRKGAGAPPKDPAAGERKMWSGRLPQTTRDTLKSLVASGKYQSEADVIVDAVSALDKRTKR